MSVRQHDVKLIHPYHNSVLMLDLCVWYTVLARAVEQKCKCTPAAKSLNDDMKFMWLSDVLSRSQGPGLDGL